MPPLALQMFLLICLTQTKPLQSHLPVKTPNLKYFMLSQKINNSKTFLNLVDFIEKCILKHHEHLQLNVKGTTHKNKRSNMEIIYR